MSEPIQRAFILYPFGGEAVFTRMTYYPHMSQQTPATVTTLKAFSDAAAALVADAKKVAATKDASAIASAKATIETTAKQIETALEAS